MGQGGSFSTGKSYGEPSVGHFMLISSAPREFFPAAPVFLPPKN